MYIFATIDYVKIHPCSNCNGTRTGLRARKIEFRADAVIMWKEASQLPGLYCEAFSPIITF